MCRDSLEIRWEMTISFLKASSGNEGAILETGLRHLDILVIADCRGVAAGESDETFVGPLDLTDLAWTADWDSASKLMKMRGTSYPWHLRDPFLHRSQTGRPSSKQGNSRATVSHLRTSKPGGSGHHTTLHPTFPTGPTALAAASTRLDAGLGRKFDRLRQGRHAAGVAGRPPKLSAEAWVSAARPPAYDG